MIAVRSAGGVARHQRRLGAPQEVRPVPGGHEEMLELTESEYAPWTIVEATSKSYTRKQCLRDHHRRAGEAAWGRRLRRAVMRPAEVSQDAELRAAMESLSEGGLMLETLDLTRSLDREATSAK